MTRTESTAHYVSKIVEGINDDDRGLPTWHVVILRHTLTVVVEDGEPVERRVSDQTVVETFTRYGENYAREAGIRRCGELTLAEDAA